MKLYKKFVFIFACLSLLFSITTFRETYAKYKTDISGSTTMSVARWRILVNNEDIRNNSESTLLITPVFTDNDNIADGYIAPTAEGYYDLVIDSTSADVSFSYSITNAVDTTSSVSDFIITGYSIDDGTVQSITNNAPITGSMFITDTQKTKTIRVYVMWNDGEGATMNNAMDTLATESGVKAKMQVSINFTQLAA